jgi:hypothetical protein
MARIIPSGLIDSVTGKLGGTVFQVSNGVLIARTRVSPRNPSSNNQQNRRSIYSELVRAWSGLTSSERNSWTDGGVDYIPGIQGFVGTNSLINLTGQPRLDTFSATNKQQIAAPLAANIQATSFLITPLPIASILPANKYFLMFATNSRPAGTGSVSSPNYRFIHAFQPGDGNGVQYDLTSQYFSVWPENIPGQRVFLGWQVIEVTTGVSGPRFLSSHTVT